MGKYSATVDGKVLNWKFERRTVSTVFRIGDKYIGQLFNMGRGDWSAVSAFPTSIGPVGGFSRRHDACEYLMQVFRYQEKLKKQTV